jgi:hypothetical protein
LRAKVRVAARKIAARLSATTERAVDEEGSERIERIISNRDDENSGLFWSVKD